MTNTLFHILERFNIDYDSSTKMPIEIPNFGRDELAGLFAELGFTKGVEIGVLDGTYSLTLMKANPNLLLYGVDPYEPHKGYRDYTRHSTFNNARASAEAKLAEYVYDNRYIFVREYSMEALSNFDDESLDFVYIDGDHEFQNVTNDIAEWSKKVKPGGIIAGHDYVNHKGKSLIHVYQAVNGYAQAYNLRPWFLAGTKAVLDGQVRDKARSWFWVKH